MIPETSLRISPKAAKAKNEMVKSDITGNKTRGALTHQIVCWNSHGKLIKLDFYTWGKFFVKLQNEKNQTKLEIIYGIKIKRREARQNWKKERKKESNREKDYVRLRSVNENEKKVKKKEKWKRRLN